MSQGFTAGVAATGFGESGFGEAIEVEYTDLSRPVVGPERRRTTFGWGAYGTRAYSRPGLYSPRNPNPGVSPPGTVQVTSVSGALQSVFRTDVRRPLINKLDFAYTETGSSSFTMGLHRLPPFPILPFSLFQIRLDNSDFDWYTGVLNYPDTGGLAISPERQREGPYKFSGKGLNQYLDSIEAHDVFFGGPDVDVTDIVREILLDFIIPRIPAIRFNDDKILSSAGKPLTNDIDASRHPVGKILGILGEMANCRWGVDGDREFFFLPYENEPNNTFFVAYDFHDWLPRDNLDKVVNYLQLNRNNETGSGLPGSTIGGIYENASSQGKYGFKKETKDYPGYWSGDTFDIVGQNYLERFAEPEPAGTAKRWRIPLSGMRYIPIGRCWVVEKPHLHWRIFDDMDSIAGWSGPVAQDPEHRVWGSDAIRIEHPGTGTTTAYLFKDTFRNFGKLKKVAFYLESTSTGQIGTWGVGLSAWDNYTQPLVATTIGRPVRCEIDLTKLSPPDGLDSIQFFGVSIDASVATTVYLDYLTVQTYGPRWLNLRVTKVKCDPVERELEVEFGVPPQSLPRFIQGLEATATELKYSQEIR